MTALAATNPFIAKAKRENPFLKLKSRENDLDQKIASESKEYESALVHAGKLFAKLDKLDMAGKTSTNKYHDLKRDWELAEREVERHFNALMSLSAQRRRGS